MAILIDVAELVGLVCECILYGVYLTLFIATTYTLVVKRRCEKFRIPMIFVSVLMIGLATAQIAVDAQNIFTAFMEKDRAARLTYLDDVTQPLFTWRHATFVSMTVVGDLFVTYRCYIVWGRNKWVVVLPIALSFSGAACGFRALWAVGNLAGETVRAQENWIIALFALSLAANALATSLIAFRIWRVDRRINELTNWRVSNFRQTVRIVAESGVLNAAYLLAYTITLVSGSEGLETMPGIATPFIGIIFSVVIIRVGLNAEREANWAVFSNHLSERKLDSTNQHRVHTAAFSIGRPIDGFGDDPEAGLDMNKIGTITDGKTNNT